jgi:photosystem II stability/assembly factor-like uncharacterized protein
MKKIYNILISFFLVTSASAQWTVIYTNSIAPIEEFRGCYFMSASTGIVVGAQTAVGSPATIRRTTNGGASWTNITNIYTDTLRSVWFVNDTIGFACGAKGRIIKTIDAGLVWDTVASGVSNLLRSVHFPTAQTGYICGGGGIIMKSIDGGNTWAQLASPLAQDLINIRFLNQDTGYACSSLGTFLSGYVIRTYDGGASWDTVHTNAQGMLGIAIANDSTVVSGGGNQTIVRTTDGGQTWSTPYTGTASTNFRASWFTSSTTGYMVGDVGSLFKTTNGGANWTPITVVTQGLLGIHFPNADTGYVVGNGVILKYITPCTPPAPAYITGNPTVACSFDTVTYCVPPIAGATSYQWNVPAGNTIISGQGDTCIAVVFGNQTSGNISCHAINTCGAGDSTTISVTVQIAPTAPTITLVGNQLMSSTANNIQWYLNGVAIPGETNQYYTLTQNGSYTVTYTSPLGCTVFSSAYVFLSTGINSSDMSSWTFIYPNPATREITVQSPEFKVQRIEIVNVLGKKVLRSEHQNTIDVSELSAGIYFVKVRGEKEERVAKFVKQ